MKTRICQTARIKTTKGKQYRKYPYPMMCNNPECPSPLKFHIISHTHFGNPANFLTMYCPFCGKASLNCDNCGKPNYECECLKTIRQGRKGTR